VQASYQFHGVYTMLEAMDEKSSEMPY